MHEIIRESEGWSSLNWNCCLLADQQAAEQVRRDGRKEGNASDSDEDEEEREREERRLKRERDKVPEKKSERLIMSMLF